MLSSNLPEETARDPKFAATVRERRRLRLPLRIAHVPRARHGPAFRSGGLKTPGSASLEASAVNYFTALVVRHLLD